jgi:4-alpha-glucanotransferase
MDDALNSLAAAAGIEASYWDIGGRLHQTSAETTRHLLSGMGFPATTETEIAASLIRLEEEIWRETLPPVIVAAQGQEIVVPLRLPATATGHLRWTLDLESGAQASGEVALDGFAVEASGARDGVQTFLRRMRLPTQPLGYHRLRIDTDTASVTDIISAPSRCYLPSNDRRYWGIAAQLYALRSRNNWGIGDFTDLRALVEWAGKRGAAAIGVNPLHALFLDTPQDASPYSPNSRLFLNPLYLDVTAIPDFFESPEARGLASSSLVGAARAGDYVDYPAVAVAKLAVLDCLYSHFRTAHGGESDARGGIFRQFVVEEGRDLNRFATFQMLSERFGTHDWTHWPQPWRKPDAPEKLSAEQAARVGFFEYLQWQCSLQLSAAAAGNSMAFGLYNDLAVSVAAASADHWANQDLFIGDARVGAPPDPFNESGQEWGVVPFNPRRLRATGYAHFIALLRANMRYAGALRIDHVMGWQRLFLIPAGGPTSGGAYMRYPLDDLLAIAALESQRNECLLIGEDLGTVPAGFRERMAATGLLSCRILYFECDGHRFHRPGELPRNAAVSAANHDLATLRGYWTSEDIAIKSRLGILDGDAERRARDERGRDKRLLLQALAEEGLYASTEEGAWTSLLADAIHAYLARSPALLFMPQADDFSNEACQANLPGSVTEYPNWRRRLSRSLEEMAADPVLTQSMATIAGERGLQ